MQIEFDERLAHPILENLLASCCPSTLCLLAQIRGWGGNLYFENTVVTSWDTTNRKPQESYKNGRSFINCVSEKVTGTTCAKNDMGECRMVSETRRIDFFLSCSPFFYSSGA